MNHVTNKFTLIDKIKNRLDKQEEETIKINTRIDIIEERQNETDEKVESLTETTKRHFKELRREITGEKIKTYIYIVLGTISLSFILYMLLFYPFY